MVCRKLGGMRLSGLLCLKLMVPVGIENYFADGEEEGVKMRTTLSLWRWGAGYFTKLKDVNQEAEMVFIPISTGNRKVEQDAKRLKLLVEGLASAS